MTDLSNEELLSFASEIVASYVSKNTLSQDELPILIQKVFKSLQDLSNPEVEVEEPLKPAVSIRASIKPDYIVCLEDGKKLKMLKRYIKTHYNLTPDEYREKWGLVSDYPMVAPNYTAQRSKLAKSIGLGQKKTGK